MANFSRTTLLLAALAALFAGIGFLIGGPRGALLAFFLALGLNFFAYWNSDKLILGMYGAQAIHAQTYPELYGMVQQLAYRANLPMPRLYVIDSEQPNAFATGRNPSHAAVAITTGLIKLLNRNELSGVIAHELAHIANRDTLIMTITASIAGAIGYLVQLPLIFGHRSHDSQRGPGVLVQLALMILAPLAALLVQMAISRTREYAADERGAQICGDPKALASALAKIDLSAHQVINETAEENPATAHLFIINPLAGGTVDNLFSTHPKTQNRIRRLKAMTSEPFSSPPHSLGPWG
jgi:heat shock protein HtpX